MSQTRGEMTMRSREPQLFFLRYLTSAVSVQ